MKPEKPKPLQAEWQADDGSGPCGPPKRDANGRIIPRAGIGAADAFFAIFGMTRVKREAADEANGKA